MIHLRGSTWANPRGYFPLEATARQYERLHPDVTITWDVRSLKDFGDYPIELLAKEYDLVMLDHPHVGISSRNGLLLKLDEWIPESYLLDQEKNSVGGSCKSYFWAGHQWALAVDVAGHVAVYRDDLLSKYGLEVPQTWDDVFELAGNLPDEMKVAIPLCPTDSICSYISLIAHLGGPVCWKEETGIDRAAGEEALYLLQRLKSLLHPKSFRMNPIHMLNYMSDSNEIAYVPLTFSYSNYSRPGFVSNVLHFTGIPSQHGKPSGAIQGGGGFAISALSQHRQAAVDYLMYTCSGEIQSGVYFASGGQPGHRSAWTDPEVNRKSNDFFTRTLETMDLSYVRPRHPGYNEFQEQAGEIIHDFLLRGRDYRAVYRQLNQLYLDLSEGEHA